MIAYLYVCMRHHSVTFATRFPKMCCFINWIFLLCRYGVTLYKTGISNRYYQKFLYSKKNVSKEGLTVQLNRTGLDWRTSFTSGFTFKMEIPGQCNLLQNRFLKSTQNIKPPLIFPGYFSFGPQQCLPMTYHAVLYNLPYSYNMLVALDIPKLTWAYASTLNNRHLGNSSFYFKAIV